MNQKTFRNRISSVKSAFGLMFLLLILPLQILAAELGEAGKRRTSKTK